MTNFDIVEEAKTLVAHTTHFNLAHDYVTMKMEFEKFLAERKEKEEKV